MKKIKTVILIFILVLIAVYFSGQIIKINGFCSWGGSPGVPSKFVYPFVIIMGIIGYLLHNLNLNSTFKFILIAWFPIHFLLIVLTFLITAEHPLSVAIEPIAISYSLIYLIKKANSMKAYEVLLIIAAIYLNLLWTCMMVDDMIQGGAGVM